MRFRFNLRVIAERIVLGLLILILGISIGSIYVNYLQRLPDNVSGFDYVNTHVGRDNSYGRCLGLEPKDTTIHSRQGINEALHDLNKSRAKHRVAPLKLSKTMSKVARVRAKQAFYMEYIQHKNDDTSVHEVLDHNSTEEERLMPIYQPNFNQISQIGENVSPTRKNSVTYTNGRRGSVTYHHVTNANRMADVANKDMMKHDQFCNNGHKKNILDSGFKKVGIAMYYQPYTHIAIFVEDFIS